MKTTYMALYNQKLHLLQRAVHENCQHVFVAYGIIHVFCQQAELAVQVFKEWLLEDGCYMAAAGTDREIIMDAYERYAFVDDEIWLAILKDKEQALEDKEYMVLVERIVEVYIPVFVLLQEEAQRRMERAI